ncbi:unnamed protein product [Gordionus sp. m RMFG-2023]|uniref:tetratricopeptide repeat protein 32-like n=1 Tax=Gordionus sp. m RMFG-2023 TaxID=3053472 RepID=UPI0030E02390
MNVNSLFDLYDKCEGLINDGKADEAEKFLDSFIDNSLICFKHPSTSFPSTTLQNQLKQKLALAYNNRGLLKYFTVDFEKAVQDYTSAISYNNKLAPAYYNRGLIYYRLGNFNEAISDLHSSLSIDPSFVSAQQCLQTSISGKRKKLPT